MNPYRTLMFSFAGTRFGRWFQLKTARPRRALDLILYRLSRGRLTLLSGVLPCAMLTTVGRKTGRRLTTPVLYQARDDDTYVVVASKGGAPGVPNWMLNVQRQPRASLGIRGTPVPVLGRVVSPEQPEWPDLWAASLAFNSTYQVYRDQKGHEIPIVVFTPVTEFP